ncbi:MAG TPA: methyltransferase domain-containing protein [Beijerinckiaceae bacterium]|nr:methyltransferase domain-containing protein [Beijerinckiaceae bacterium]
MSRDHSSGDLAADRRYLWAEASLKEGDAPAAADLFHQALALAPHFSAAVFGLGSALERMGDVDGARTAYRRCLDQRPDDVFGAGLSLARLDGATPAAMPQDYVARLFDDYAGRFESHLVGALHYRGPAILVEALEAVTAAQQRPCRFLQALDLGCGTGLMADALGGRVQWIDGVDLSSGMLAQAAARGHYRSLIQADITAALAMLPAGQSYDLVIAADVLVYLGDLGDLFRAIAAALAPGGLFAFTVQAGPDGGYALGGDLRFSHGAGYLGAVAGAAGLRLTHLAPAVTRKDAGRDVAGYAAVLESADQPPRTTGRDSSCVQSVMDPS